eukprot:1300974-Prymnesium_polylepis.1
MPPSRHRDQEKRWRPPPLSKGREACRDLTCSTAPGDYPEIDWHTLGYTCLHAVQTHTPATLNAHPPAARGNADGDDCEAAAAADGDEHDGKHEWRVRGAVIS